MINYDLNKIKAIVFDVDGVLSCQTITLSPAGEPLRTVNIKDGYAIQLAQKSDLRIVILTGGKSEAIRLRYAGLGVEDIYMGCAVKIKTYREFLEKYQLTNEEISTYVSSCNGGEGCGRDVVEQVLRAQGKWLSGAKAFGW